MTAGAPAELLTLSDQREAKARDLLDHHRLAQRLSNAGDVHVVGSVALGVVYQEDIDLLVLVDEVYERVVESIVAELLSSDFRLLTSRWLGDGVQRRLAYTLRFRSDEPWQLDLCFARRDAYAGLTPSDFVSQRRRNLGTEERRGAVLAIKASLARQQSTNKVSSNHIYDYVLATDKPSVDGFRAWLESRP